MTTQTLTWPVSGGSLFPKTTLPIVAEGDGVGRLLPRVEQETLPGPILQKNPFGNTPDIKSVHYLLDCPLQCSFCYSRPQINETGGLTVRLRADAAQQLHQELTTTFKKPQAVYVCPHADPFPPLREVQEETARVVEVLGQTGVQAWLMTRGYIRPFAVDVLARFKDRVKVMMGLTTLDRSLQRVLEPLSAPPRLRLKQIRQLRALGIPVQAALEPLVPGVTDTRGNLRAVLEALADLGVQRVTAGYLFLPPGSQERLQQQLQPHGWDALVLDAFADGFEKRTPELGRVRYLAKSRRQKGYALLMALAAEFGITVSISSLSNPDFTRPEPVKVFSQGYLPGLGQMESLSVG